MEISPILRQVLVAVSSQLAAVSTGGAVAFPSLLLQQLSSNSSGINLDLDTASWIGSIHGLAGIPSFLMPSLMQWRGRKLAFIVTCLISIVGWIFAGTGNNIAAILAGECFQGLSANSIHAVSLLSMSEMLAPRYRNVSLILFFVFHALGLALVGVLGRYFHWKTVSCVMIFPMTMAMLAGFKWPESPAWLAYKGRFEECERSFTWLRGSCDLAKKELEELMITQRERKPKTQRAEHPLKSLWKTLKSRDFYVPSLHIIVLMDLMYWSGGVIFLIYSMEFILRLTQNGEVALYGGAMMNSIVFVCVCINVVLVRQFKNKTVLLSSTFSAVLCMFSLSGVNYAQYIGIIPEDSLVGLYIFIGLMVSVSLGVLPQALSIASELLPVRHRGVGGVLYVILTCLFHATSLKSLPYLFKYLSLWGTLLLFAVNGVLSGLFIWKYVPETKGKTLQQLEGYYAYGSFKKRHEMTADEDIAKWLQSFNES